MQLLYYILESWLHFWNVYIYLGFTLSALAWSCWENVIYLKKDTQILFLDMALKIPILQLSLPTVSLDVQDTNFCLA